MSQPALIPTRRPLEYVLDRAHAAFNGQDFGTADTLYTQALQMDPENPTARLNRGRVRHKIGQYAEAADDFRRLLHTMHGHPKVWFYYGAALMMDHQDLPAIAALEKAIDLDPLDPEAHHTYAGALHLLNRDEEALREWGLAHQMDPSRAETAVGQAMTLLRQDAGRSVEGWRMFEARRWKGIVDTLPGMPMFTGAAGQNIDGRSIMVRCEQGYGDTLQFIRYLLPLQAAGARVTLETPTALLRLVRESFPGVRVFQAGSGVPPRCDWQTSLMSLPAIFNRYDAGAEPYIHLNEDDYQTPDPRNPPAIGFVWHGGARPEDPDAHSIDKRRSLPPLDATNLMNALHLRARVVSLQQEDLPDSVATFYETAQIISGLDLVISVDTAVAHLAGAMGKPVWLLNRYSSCWRWGATGDASHWYPSMRIFRQPTAGDWETVIARVLAAWDKEHSA